MNKQGMMRLITLVFRLVIGIIFLYAGIMKIIDPAGFAQALYNYRLLPGWAINPLAITLPWVECVAGASLLLGIWTLGGGAVASMLFAIFAAALGINLIRGLDISCGCFSAETAASPITWLTVVRDLLLLGMSVAIVLFDQGGMSLERLWHKNPASGVKARKGRRPSS
jgi:putative oxidoreductase